MMVIDVTISSSPAGLTNVPDETAPLSSEHYSTLKMVAVISSRTLFSTYQSASY
jgi:hypothetical protein